MTTIKVKLGFAAQTDSELLIATRHYASGMTTCGYFAGATALVTSVTAAATVFEAAIQTAKRGGEGTVAMRNTKRKDLEAVTRILASYAEDNCGSDANKVLAAGFALRETQANMTKALGAPAAFVAKTQTNGAMTLKFQGGENRVISEVQSRIVGAADYGASFFCTERTLILNGFAAGTQYEFRLRCIGKSQQHGAANTSAWVQTSAWGI
jgi:hypothetical protein